MMSRQRSALMRDLAVAAACLVVATPTVTCMTEPQPKTFRPSLTWGPCPAFD